MATDAGQVEGNPCTKLETYAFTRQPIVLWRGSFPCMRVGTGFRLNQHKDLRDPETAHDQYPIIRHFAQLKILTS